MKTTSAQLDDEQLVQAVRVYVHDAVSRDIDDSLVHYASVLDAARAIVQGTHASCALQEKGTELGVLNMNTGKWESLNAGT